MKKYIKCFSENQKNELQLIGFEFLYEQNGVYYFENNETLFKNNNKNKVVKKVKFSDHLNF